MPIPTTNLTGQFNASDNDHIWTTFDSGTPPYHSGVPADGNEVQVWDDEQGLDLSMLYPSVTSNSPNYRSSTPLMLLPCLDFDGTEDYLQLYPHAGGTAKSMSDLFAAGGKTAIAAVYIESVTTNNANAWTNEAILADNGGFWGIHLKNTGGGAYQVVAYNWDGSADTVALTITLTKSWIVVLRHDGTDLYLDLYDTSGTSPVTSGSTASGNTTDLTNDFFVGRNISGSAAYYNGRVGEWATWNVALTGTDLTDAIAYFRDRWTPSASSGWGPLLGLERHRLVRV